jgi:hypothetical protein
MIFSGEITNYAFYLNKGYRSQIELYFTFCWCWFKTTRFIVLKYCIDDLAGLINDFYRSC